MLEDEKKENEEKEAAEKAKAKADEKKIEAKTDERGGEKKSPRSAEALAFEEADRDRKRLEVENAQLLKEKKARDDKELADQGKWKELAESRGRELEQERSKSAARLEKTAIRSSIVTGVLELGIGAVDARAIAELVSMEGIKVEEDGRVVGVEAAIKKHIEVQPRLYEIAKEAAKVDGKDKKPEEKRSEEGKKVPRTLADVRGVRRGVRMELPKKEDGTAMHVRDMDAKQYADYKRSLSGGGRFSRKFGRVLQG